MPIALRFLLTFIVLGGVLAAANRHVFRWVDDAFSPPRAIRRALLWVLAGSWFVTFAGRVVEYALWADAPLAWILTVTSVVELSVLMGSVLLLALDLVLWLGDAKRWGPRLLRRWRSEPSVEVAANSTLEKANASSLTTAASYTASEPRLPRRSFLAQASAGSALLVSSGSSLYGTLAGRHDYEMPEVPVLIPGLSRQLDGFTIAQLSDVHIGQFVGPAQLAAAEALLSRAKADLIVLTGDLLDHDARRSEDLGRFVRRLVPLARHGVVAITGNHDFYAGVDAVVAAVRAGGGRVLRNQGEVLGQANAGLALLGVDDLFGARTGTGPNLDQAIAGLPLLGGLTAPARDLPRVLLCHQPVFFERSARHVNLQLSGHTHGGQVNLLVRPADWVLPHGWVAGLYEHDDAQLYVNRGFGTAGPPTRIGAAPEVTRLVLVSS